MQIQLKRLNGLVAIFALLCLTRSAFSASPVRVEGDLLKDTEKVAFDPQLSLKAKLAEGNRFLHNQQFDKALLTARELINKADPSVLIQAESLFIKATLYAYGCEQAIKEVQQLRKSVESKRPKSAVELEQLDKSIIEMKEDWDGYRQALAVQETIIEKYPSTRRAAKAMVQTAKLACFYDSTDNTLGKLNRVIKEFSRAKTNLTDCPNTVVLADEVETVKKLFCARGGPDEAIEQLKEIEASNILNDAGAWAELNIGQIYWDEKHKQKEAEASFLRVAKIWESSPAANAAMEAAGDMYDDIGRMLEVRKDIDGAICAWKKAYEFYPDLSRKGETAYVVGFFLGDREQYEEAHEYLKIAMTKSPKELTGVRDRSVFRDAYTYYLSGDKKAARSSFEQVASKATELKIANNARTMITRIDWEMRVDEELKSERGID